MNEPTPAGDDGSMLPGEVSLRLAGDDDWPAITAVVNAARREDGAEEQYTAAVLASEYPAVVMERDGVIAEASGVMVGYGIGRVVERDRVLVGELSGAVHPAHRRRGIGTALLHRTRDAVVARLAADPRPMPRELRGGALDSETGLIALLHAEGFVPIRFFYEMRRPITGRLPTHPLSAGIELRPVVEADHRAIFDGNEEAFRDHWSHRPATEQDFHDLFAGPDMTPGLWCVAWDGDQVAGVVVNTIRATENEALGIRRGWLDRVSVRRPWRGRGVAKALCCESFRVLREQGMDEAWLAVDGSNPTGAVHLYEGLGFHVSKGFRVFGRPADGPAPSGWRTAGDRETIGG
ncbi:MAG: GNAT family N-acetyltransferase [Candidatus Limnocylindrales bacterium]